MLGIWLLRYIYREKILRVISDLEGITVFGNAIYAYNYSNTAIGYRMFKLNRAKASDGDIYWLLCSDIFLTPLRPHDIP